MNIKKIITLLLVVILLLTTFIGCKKSTDDISSNSSESSNTVYGNVDIVDDENTSSDTSDVSQNDDNSSQTEPVDNSDTNSTDSSTTVSEPNTNTNPDGKEIYGTGTADDPYIDFPDAESHIVKTLSIPAGKSVFYSISRVGGRILTINDASAFVVCDGIKHTAKNGVLSFKVVDALASDAVAFEIGNTASTDKNFTIVFSDIKGTSANPEIIKNIGETVSVDLEEGNDKGYFYNYFVEESGILKFYLLSDAKKGALHVNRIRNDISVVFGTDVDGEFKSDDLGTYVEIEVEKGDKIVIDVVAIPDSRKKFRATTIEWLAK